MAELHHSLIKVRRKIEQAARRSDRNVRDITLLAVTKTVDDAAVRQAYDLGITDFGENRVQELNHKMSVLPEAHWHFIGRLQTNKVKELVGRAFLIHSLDRWTLALELNRRGRYLGIKVPVLVQVNISAEDTKTGLSLDDVESFFQSLRDLSSLQVLGLMTIARQSSEPEESRPVFRELAELRNKLNRYQGGNIDLKYLSMGMSQDYEVAIEEGANIVRVGGALFT